MQKYGTWKCGLLKLALVIFYSPPPRSLFSSALYHLLTVFLFYHGKADNGEWSHELFSIIPGRVWDFTMFSCLESLLLLCLLSMDCVAPYQALQSRISNRHAESKQIQKRFCWTDRVCLHKLSLAALSRLCLPVTAKVLDSLQSFSVIILALCLFF